MLHHRPFGNLIIALTAVALFAAPAAAKPATTPFALTAELAKARFSGTIQVTDRGSTVVSRTMGLADRSFGVPIRRDTRFRIASITKLFTAVLVLKLAEEGRIDLDAPFHTYLPAYPGPGADGITVRHLLGHMSGLPQFDTVTSLEQALAEGLPNYQRPRTPRQLLELCCAKAPVRDAGSSFDYNNADYIVLGQVIEAVTGEPYAKALERGLLAPLGLSDTGMARWDATIARLARTSFRAPGSKRFGNEMPFFWENGYAAGGLYSDVDDVARFADALFGGRLLQPASMAALLKPAGDDYGLGLWSYSFTRHGVRHRVAKRPGSIMGANAMLYRLPDRGISIVILANSNAVDLDSLAQRLAEAVIDGRPIR